MYTKGFFDFINNDESVFTGLCCCFVMRLLPKMSVAEYKRWSKDARRFDASTKSFHRTGFGRTLNVLQGDARPSSVTKWRAFRARWTPNIRDGVTYKEAIAVRNWGFDVPIPKKFRD